MYVYFCSSRFCHIAVESLELKIAVTYMFFRSACEFLTMTMRQLQSHLMQEWMPIVPIYIEVKKADDSGCYWVFWSVWKGQYDFNCVLLLMRFGKSIFVSVYANIFNWHAKNPRFSPEVGLQGKTWEGKPISDSCGSHVI